MHSVDQARDLIVAEARGARWDCLRVVPLGDALGRHLAQDAVSDIDSPPHDRSIVDGYAVDAASIGHAGVVLDVIEEVTAGQVPARRVVAGTATRIMTGAPLPAGATAVVMVEKTEVVSQSPPCVRIGEQPREGQNIARRGASFAAATVVLTAGTRLGPAQIGLLAEVGHAELEVFSPSVAVLATGNEIVPASAFPSTGQIRNSNGPMLSALVQQAGGASIDLGVARDQEEELTARIEAGLAADLLVLSGGVSAGVLDLVPGVLARLGVKQVFHKVNLKPGKPIWFGIFTKASGAKTLVFGLPGNPVSTFVCFELFVRFAIETIVGARAPRTACARLTAEHRQRGERPTYWPSKLEETGPHLAVTPLPWQGSGDLRTLAEANCLAFFPGVERTYGAGEEVTVYRL